MTKFSFNNCKINLDCSQLSFDSSTCDNLAYCNYLAEPLALPYEYKIINGSYGCLEVKNDIWYNNNTKAELIENNICPGVKLPYSYEFESHYNCNILRVNTRSVRKDGDKTYMGDVFCPSRRLPYKPLYDDNKFIGIEVDYYYDNSIYKLGWINPENVRFSSEKWVKILDDESIQLVVEQIDNIEAIDYWEKDTLIIEEAGEFGFCFTAFMGIYFEEDKDDEEGADEERLNHGTGEFYFDNCLNFESWEW